MSIKAITSSMAVPHGSINTTQKLVLVALADRCGDSMSCFPSIERIGADLGGMPKRTIINAINGLVEAGLVKRQKRRTEGGTQQSTVYHLSLGAASCTQSIDRVPSSVPTGCHPVSEPGAVSGTLTQREPKEEPKDTLFALEQPNETAKATPIAICDWWNAIAKSNGLSEIRFCSTARATKLNARLATFPTLMEELPELISNSTFLVGWKAFGLDWLIKNDDNMGKVLEGKYTDEVKAPIQEPTPHSPLEPTRFVFHERAEGFDPSKHLDWMNGGKA